jgi:serine protease
MKLFRFLHALPLLAALAACDQGATGPDGTARAPGELAPLLAAGAAALPGRYIVVMNDDGQVGTAGAVARDVVAAHGGRVHHTYGHALNGFAASLSPAAVDALRRNPRVRYVAEDQVSYPDSMNVQPGATWGLDRIDQRSLPLNSQYTYTRTGQGVRVYVIDSGIRTTHVQFGGRASVGADFVGDGRNGQDCNGHGTHVAGTVAGSTYGVAKQAQVVSVRVFGCTDGAPFSTIIAAVDWVTANAQKPAVANMSLSGPHYPALNEAVRASIASGVVYAVSAGNANADACGSSPASTPEALTIGSSAGNDARSSFSNWGTCVDLFAPGSAITSAWATGDTAIGTISGTSMAAPHVSGVAALFLQGTPAATPAQAAAQMLGSTSVGRMTDPAGSPNRLLFSGLTQEPALGSLQAAPTALAFRFVRPVAGAAAQSFPSSAPAQTFTAGGEGIPRSTAAGARPDAAYATTAAWATGQVLLSNRGNTTIEWNAAPGAAWLSATPGDGVIAAGQGARVNVSVDASALAAGVHAAQVTFTDSAASTPAEYLSVNVTVQDAIVLQVGTPRTGQSGASGSETFYAVAVPAGATSLTISTSAGTGDADLYVRYGDVPTQSTYHCRPWFTGNVETCILDNPQPGTYYVMLHGYAAYSDVTLSATAGGPPAPPAALATRPYTATSLRTSWTDTASNETGFTVSRRTETEPGTWSAWAEVGTMPANSPRFTQTATPGVAYQYRVRSCNEAGCSAWAAAAPAAIPTAAPAAPFGAVATATGGTRAGLSWTDASSNEASFTVTRSLYDPAGTWGPYEAAGGTLADVAQHTVTGLLAGRTYRFQVNACNVVGCSAPATSGGVALPTLPTAPGGLTATVLSGTAVRLSWTDASSNETSFQVSRAVVASTGAVGAYADVAAVGANQAQFTVGGLTAGTTYRFRVRACNVAGCTAPATTPNTTVAAIPAAPTGFAATATSPTQMRVTWTDVSGETSYSLTRALRNADGTWGAAVTVGSYAAGTTLVDDSGLAPAATYRYQLRACNLSGCSLKITVAGVTPAS